MQQEYAIKVRQKGAKIWTNYLSGKGGMNRLRVHAARWTKEEFAQQVVDDIHAKNPDFEAKVVKI